jgi:hypothetical protein
MEKKTFNQAAYVNEYKKKFYKQYAGFQHLQFNKSSKYRRNAVFFCQIFLFFVLYMLYN